MKTNHAYYVSYKLYNVDRVRGIDVLASSKAEAYGMAVYTLIPQKEGEPPYSAWVKSVTYNNGNYRQFNTFEGKPL